MSVNYEKVCNGEYCNYKHCGGSNPTCLYQGYCDHQTPKDSRFIPEPEDDADKLHGKPKCTSDTLSGCCGKPVWISRLGKRICTGCKRAEATL